MRDRDPRATRSTATALALVAALLVGCAGATIPPPAGWLPGPTQALTSARGAWISVELRGRREPTTNEKLAAGELIAIDVDSLFILRGDTLSTYPVQALGRAQVTVHSGMNGRKDFVAPGTTPHSILRPSRRLWRQLAPYARFPQGLPAELDRRTLAGG